ncbi:MAG: RluA family pseudouridine synthase [Desulfobacteraceae bacterium]|nr:RluA family pseudouridine synthase [Desulfobacteraceae bacterium]
MMQTNTFTFKIDKMSMGIRLDAVVADTLETCSRSFAGRLIREGHIRVNGNAGKPGYRVKEGDNISGSIPDPGPIDLDPEPIPLDILFEDSDILVVNKAAGMVVHPAPGHYSGTLVNAVLYHCRDLQGISGDLRPGIVHRLDKDTSGVMVVAKNDRAHQNLAAQFKSRETGKKYLALVHGDPRSESGQVNLPIGRHTQNRKKMSTSGAHSRVAVTLWRVRERYSGITLLELKIETGRTHQIRVHCLSMHHPVVGDSVYNHRRWEKQLPLPGSDGSRRLISTLNEVRRQMLHAFRLEFRHPRSGDPCRFEAPLAEDMQVVVEQLRALTSENSQ